MKKYCIVFICAMMSAALNANPMQRDDEPPAKQSDRDWYNCSFEVDGVYGAEVNRAYEFLSKMKPKKRPLIAVLCSGADMEHDDLQKAQWTNRKEKANGRDDDKNGLVDDIHGWNWLGGADGRVVERTMSQGDREFLRLKDKYADYIFDGENYLKIVDGKKNVVPAPENMQEYEYYRNCVIDESRLASLYSGTRLAYLVKDYALQYDRRMKEQFPGRELTVKEFEINYDPDAPRDSLSEVAFMLMVNGFGLAQTDKWETVFGMFGTDSFVENAQKSYEENLFRYGYDSRADITGDDPLDIGDTGYGNNVLSGMDATAGTMIAGIVGGKRANGHGGIMDGARIMTLRVTAGNGAPCLKDEALAIRYAVDHGADVIVMPCQGTLYPDGQREWVTRMLEYAESKDVLVIVPVRESADDLSVKDCYPNRRMAGKEELTNLITVAASDKYGNPSMEADYGVEGLDLFAPGIDIRSTCPGNSYCTGTGPGLASASVAGVAALLRAYYPSLSASQIREILLQSATSRKGVEVEKNMRVDGERVRDLFLFEDLCLSGGILNAYQAVLAADKSTEKNGR